MSGIEMMLKSFGVDPEAIKESMQKTVAAINTFDARLLAIETKQQELCDLVNGLIQYNVTNAVLMNELTREVVKFNGRNNSIDSRESSQRPDTGTSLRSIVGSSDGTNTSCGSAEPACGALHN